MNDNPLKYNSNFNNPQEAGFYTGGELPNLKKSCINRFVCIEADKNGDPRYGLQNIMNYYDFKVIDDTLVTPEVGIIPAIVRDFESHRMPIAQILIADDTWALLPLVSIKKTRVSIIIQLQTIFVDKVYSLRGILRTDANTERWTYSEQSITLT